MTSTVPASAESVFTYGAPQLKFGPGAADEIGFDLSQYGVRRALVVTHPESRPPGSRRGWPTSWRRSASKGWFYDRVHVEPTDESMTAAIEQARASGPWDAFVAVGGGSSIDTAKAINLLTTNPGELMDYINPPVGGGRAPASPLKPLIAVPTTTGTGAESTTVCVLDVLALKVKTGISHARLRPTLAVVDPLLTLTQPAWVTASAGMDILCHALESYTARWYTSYDRKRPEQRVPYCGSKPGLGHVVGAGHAAAGHVVPDRRAPGRGRPGPGRHGHRGHVRGDGVRQRRGAHPARQRVPDRLLGPGLPPKDYPDAEPMVPHGMSVALTAPEAFRFTFDANPERHIRAAQMLAPDADRPARDADFLPSVLTALMRDIDIPNGVAAVGFTAADIPALVEGTTKQQRLLATCPKPVTEDDLGCASSRRPWSCGSHAHLSAALCSAGRAPGLRGHPVAARTAAAVPGVRRASGQGPGAVRHRRRGGGVIATAAGGHAADLAGYLRRKPGVCHATAANRGTAPGAGGPAPRTGRGPPPGAGPRGQVRGDPAAR